MRQSALESNCSKEDFYKFENVVTISKPNSKARCYLNLPFYLDMVSYGNNIVASVNSEMTDEIKAYINTYSTESSFEPQNIYLLNEMLKKHDMKVCFMAEYFLPDLNLLVEKPCEYKLRILEKDQLVDLYIPKWSNALCKKRKQLDMMAVGAYDGEKLVGLAGCSADCDTMWQIGVDVLPEYRKQGIASAITSRLALEVLNKGKVPFYCATWTNIKSIRNAINSGFKLAYVELTAKNIKECSDIADNQ